MTSPSLAGLRLDPNGQPIDRRKLQRDRAYVDMLHRKMLDAHRIYALAASAHDSALRAYEQRYGSDR